MRDDARVLRYVLCSLVALCGILVGNGTGCFSAIVRDLLIHHLSVSHYGNVLNECQDVNTESITQRTSVHNHSVDKRMSKLF